MLDLLHKPFQIAGRVIDPIAGTVCYRGSVNKIPPRAVRVLCMLAEQPNKRVLRNTLVSEIWGDNYLVGQKAISQAIWQLRKALSADEDLIQTVPREGYSLLVEPESVQAHSGFRPVPIAVGLSLAGIVLVLLFSRMSSDSIVSTEFSELAGQEQSETIQNDPEPGRSEIQNQAVEIGFPLRTIREVDGLGAVLSPDGSRIVYQREIDGHFDLVMFDAARQDGFNLTQSSGVSEWWPSFSPDGNRLAYWARTESDCGLRIHTLTQNASIEELEGDCPPLSSGAVSWSQDGLSLYLARPTLAAQQTAIFRHDLGTRRETQVSFPADPRFSDSRPTVSPDGNRLALIRSSAEGAAILPLIDLGTGDERIASPDGLQPRDLAWSSDGTQLFTTASWQSRRQLVSIDVESRGVTGYSLNNVSTVDARADLVLAQDKSSQNQLWTATLSGRSELRMISAIGHSPRTPEFYRNKLIFSASHESGAAIWQTSKSAAIRQVAAVRSGSFWGPRVSPRLGVIAALWANQHAMSGVLIDERSGNIAWLTLSDDTRMIDIDWSADGETLYFVASQGDDWALWQRELSSVNPPELISSDGVRDIELSRHDGQLYALKAGGFFRIDASGDNEILFEQLPWPGMWTPVPDGIVTFRRDDYAAPFELWRYGFDGNTERITTLPSGITPLQSISYDPDQDQIVFATASVTSQSLQVYAQSSLPVQPNIETTAVNNPIPIRSQDCVSALWQRSNPTAPLCVDQSKLLSAR